MPLGNIEQTKRFVCKRSVFGRGFAQASRTPPISVKTAVSAAVVALLVGDHVGDGVDQRQVGEGLGEVAEVAARLGVQLLGDRGRASPAASSRRSQSSRARRALADLRERRDQPEGADQEGALLAAAGRRRSPRPCSGGRGRARSARRRSRRPWRARAGRRGAGSGAAGSAAARRRARRCRSAGGRRRRGRRARGSPRGSRRRFALPLLGDLVEAEPRARRAPRSTATQIISFEET